MNTNLDTVNPDLDIFLDADAYAPREARLALKHLSSRWGMDRTDDRVRVWFEIDRHRSGPVRER